MVQEIQTQAILAQSHNMTLTIARQIADNNDEGSAQGAKETLTLA